MSEQQQREQLEVSSSSLVEDDGFLQEGMPSAVPSSTARTSPEKRGVQSNSSDVQWHARKNSTILTPKSKLPAGPSMVGSFDKEREKVVVFNANTPEGNSMVRALAKSGCEVLALVRVFTSKNTKSLLKLPHVIVKVADGQDQADLIDKCAGVHRAFFCTTYWECFDGTLEEKQASMIVNACAQNNVHHLVFSSFEDTKTLKEKNLKSQIKPDQHGIIWPQFKGMKTIKRTARKQNVMLTHMLTSYIDQEKSKKSLCLIVGENGTLIVQPHLRD